MKNNNYILNSTLDFLDRNAEGYTIDNKTAIFTNQEYINKIVNPEFGRKRFLDLNVSLFDLIQKEKKLIDNKSIEDNHLLYQYIMNEYAKLPAILKEQANYLFTLAYLEGGHDHWNKIQFVNSYEIQKLIQHEIKYDGCEKSYNVFSSKLGEDYLRNLNFYFISDDLNKNTIPLNMREINFLSLLVKNGKSFESHLELNNKIMSLNLNIDYDKILKIISKNDIKYHNLLSINDEVFNNKEIQLHLNDKVFDTNILNLAKFNYMDYSLTHMISGRSYWNINKEQLFNWQECINHYLNEESLKHLVKDFFEHKIKLSVKNKGLWHGLYMHYYLDTNEENTKQTKKIKI